MDQRPSISYPLQFAILIGAMGTFLVLSAIILPFLGAILLHVPPLQVMSAMLKPENAGVAGLLNTVASFFGFLLPALMVARAVSFKPFGYLGFNRAINTRQCLLVIVITFAGMVLGGALGELNERIPLPATWYAKAKALEDTYKAAMMAMANMRSGKEFITGLLVLAAFPAVFEEVLFRGGFQQVFVGWTKSKWAGIIITSVLFSAIHFSYFGFLPRAALGIVLGLIFYYSKNIWLSILLHFLNNAFVVTELYIATKQGRSIEKTMDESLPMWWGIITIILLVIFFRAFKKQSEAVLGEKEKHFESSPENLIS